MPIYFKKIDETNYEECATLKVHEQQEAYVAPNWFSLLEVHYEEGERHPLAIYDGETMVGFLMYVFYPADEDYHLDSWWVERLMIDQRYQNKGYGQEALTQFTDFFKKEYNNSPLRIATEPENKVAIQVYEKVGFAQTGEFAAGEMVLCHR